MDMSADSLAAALEWEHHEIDDGIAAFAVAPGDQQPLVRAIRALRRHIYLEEEKVLYPRADELLPTTAADRLRSFLDAGEMPEGWVCFKARPEQ